MASIKNGDEPETYWILKLEKPVCVNGDEQYDLDFVYESGVSDVQLVLHGENPYMPYKQLMLKKVIADGVLFHAHTGHHRSVILLSVESISRLKGQKEGGGAPYTKKKLNASGKSVVSVGAGNVLTKESGLLSNVKKADGGTPYSKARLGADGKSLIYAGADNVLIKDGGSLTWRTNNPGNLSCGLFTGSHGAIGCENGIAVFPDIKAGDDALTARLKTQMYQSKTIAEAFEEFAPLIYDEMK